MMALQIIGEALGLAIGSLVAAVVFSWLCWNAFKLLHHPELGVPLCLAVLLATWSSGFAGSPFLRQAGAYAALLAIVLWPVGIAWRRKSMGRFLEKDC
jgi:hypothetical protein